MQLIGPDGSRIEFNTRCEQFWLWMRRFCEGGEHAIPGLFQRYVVGYFATQHDPGLSRASWARLVDRAAGQCGRKLTETCELIAQHFDWSHDGDEHRDGTD